MFFLSTKKNVLVIDDDRSLLRQLKFRLEKREKLNVVTTENAEKGLELASAVIFDLIILDWMLPGQQGIDILGDLKSSEATRDIPVLMMTGRNKIGELEEAFSRGAEAYLTKPFELSKLGRKVTEMLAA